MTYNRKNKQLLIRNVCAIVQRHYEPGNQQKCYKAIWKRHVFPVYPICYRTFLTYIGTPPPHREPDDRTPAPPKKTY